MGLLLFSTIYYLPAFASNPDTEIHLDNLLNRLSDTFTGPYLLSTNIYDPALYLDWFEGRTLARDFRLPLWSVEKPGQYLFRQPYGYRVIPGGQPLLAASSAPLLYPLSLIYYFAPGDLALFALVHLWLFGFGLVLLVRKWRRWRYPGLGLLALMLPVGGLQLDWLAALAWVPLGMWLLTSERRTNRLLFAFISGLILLGVNWALALILLGLLLAWALGCEVVLRRAGMGQTLRVAGLLLVMLALGAGMAGPQLFPRLAYTYGPDKAADFTPPQSGQQLDLRPAQNIQNFRIERRSPTEIEVLLNVPSNTAPFEVVLPERYAGGWTATIFGKQILTEKDEKDRERQREQDINKGREGKVTPTAEGWRSVQVSPAPEGGELRVRYRYNPLAFTLGLYAAFLAVASVAMSFVGLIWRRYYREDEGSPAIRRVAKNSVTPLFAQLFGKALDFGFALFSLRLLGPDGNGRYTIAVTTWLIFATLTDFGLETIVTREVARDRSPENANRYYYTMLLTRLGLVTLSFPLALLWVGGFSLTGNMAGDTAWAIVLLMFSFIPESRASSMTALFRAYEKYEFLAANQILTAIIRVPLGLGALLAGWGVVGLAGSAVVVNFIKVAVLSSTFKREVLKPRFKDAFDWGLARSLLILSYPLLLNSILNNILFKSDALLLGAIQNDTQVGLYNSAYKFIDAVLIIPSAFTLALFPVLANYGKNARPELKRAYTEGLRLLLIIGLPLSAGTVFVAYDLIGALGGASFLPGGAICLQILIWFLPFSYVNGLTQYVLIALNKQRLITFALIAAAVINVGLNLLFIPFFGYIAASAMTIVAELVMLGPFCWLTWRELGHVPYFKLGWRPTLAAGLMMLGLFGLTAGLGINNFFVTVAVGAVIYLTVLIITRTVTASDVQMLKKIVSRG